MSPTLQLPVDRMSEAEVALRLAFHLLGLHGSSGEALVAIDGAQVVAHGAEVFPLADFLRTEGWSQVQQSGKNSWQGIYEKSATRIDVRSQSGVGDVVCTVLGRRYRAECKKGPLLKKKGSPEYPLIREALGQLLTVEAVRDDDVLMVAVPRTDQFDSLASAWRDRPLIRKTGIKLVLVGRDGSVAGLDGPSETMTFSSDELVPTEAELARAEGRSFESAEEMLKRVRQEQETNDSTGAGTTKRARRGKRASRGRTARA